MKYVYPNNLMARRGDSSDVVKGAFLLAGIVLLILVFFYASSPTHYAEEAYLQCAQGPNGLECGVNL